MRLPPAESPPAMIRMPVNRIAIVNMKNLFIIAYLLSVSLFFMSIEHRVHLKTRFSSPLRSFQHRLVSSLPSPPATAISYPAIAHPFSLPRAPSSKVWPEALSYGLLKASGYCFLNPSRLTLSASTRKPLQTIPVAFLEVVLRGVILFMAPPRHSTPGTMKSALAPWSIRHGTRA